mmetsp:Transcript_8732/g.29141  ORF Transcript_8732/g.29141 Transcript_8732/m.29141 type:complete len:233 (-) Transcript_8732:1084-1782(-)
MLRLHPLRHPDRHDLGSDVWPSKISRQRQANRHEQFLSLSSCALAQLVHPLLEIVTESGGRIRWDRVAVELLDDFVRERLEIVPENLLRLLCLGGFLKLKVQHGLQDAAGVVDEIAFLLDHPSDMVKEFFVSMADHFLSHHRLCHQRKELLFLHRSQMLTVDPLELLHVEHGGGGSHSVEVEGGDQLLPAVDVLVCPVVPSQQRQVVDHGIGKKALLAKLVARGGAMALGEL